MENGQPVASVIRALRIMQSFTEGRSLSLTEIAERVDLYKSTTLRLLGTLEGEGFIQRNTDGRYSLGPTLWRLGSLYEASIDLRSTIMPALERMSEETLETSSFDVREGSHRLCIGRISGRHPVQDYPVDGAILPLGIGAPGRVLVDFGDGPRGRSGRDLIYLSLGERHPEMASISIPIFGKNHILHGALCITGTVSRYSDSEYLEALKTVLIRNARDLSTLLGGNGKQYAD